MVITIVSSYITQVPVMVSEARLLECFNEAKSPILAEEELRAWWEKERDSMQQQQLSDSLRVLVEEEKLGERSVCVGDSQTKVYWIKNQGQYLNSTLSMPCKGSHNDVRLDLHTCIISYLHF